MKITIISDTHNNQVNLEKVVKYCAENKINIIISCGDLASKETLDYLVNNFLGTIHHVFGNMDDEHIPELKNIYNYRDANIYHHFGEVVIDGVSISFTHFPETAKELAMTGKYRYVFFGHTHKPWEEKIGETKILNPGSVTGDRFQPTFAVWDTKKDAFELVLLNEIS